MRDIHFLDFPFHFFLAFYGLDVFFFEGGAAFYDTIFVFLNSFT